MRTERYEGSRIEEVHVSAQLKTVPILLLNVHESCNCRCMMCDIWQRKHGKELDIEQFARQREALLRLDVRQVVLTGGEPLLHRNLDVLCMFLRKCNVRITLLTTGLLLAQRARLVAENVDEIIISIDGPRGIHDHIRRVQGAYQLIQDGISAVRTIRKEIPIHGRSTVQKANFAFLRKTVASAKELRLDSISFLAADVTSQAFNRDLVWPETRQETVALNVSEIDALDRELERLLEENAVDILSRYIVESPQKLRRIVRRFREHVGQVEPIAPMCNAPWVSVVLEVDGRVRPCFFHPAIADLRDGPLNEIVNGKAAMDFRTNLCVPQNPVCQRCVCSLYRP